MSIALLARLTCDGCGATADVLVESVSRMGYPVAPLPDDWTREREGHGHGTYRDLCPSCTARGKETR